MYRMLKVICSRSLNQLWLILLIAVSVTGNPAYAGLGFSEDEIHKFRYDIKGEIMVKPDRAVFPVLITVKSKTYKQSLERANKLMAEIKAESRKLDSNIFSITSENFYKNNRRAKFSLSFFDNDDDNKAATQLVIFLIVKFTDQHDFNTKAKFIAESLDYISQFRKKYENSDAISISSENAFYEIADVEQYRERIVNSIYQKAKLMAGIIAKNEKVSAKIREVFFDQYISEEIINFDKATLFINAKIEYGFK